MASHPAAHWVRTMADKPRVHVGLGLVALVASLADVVDGRVVDIAGFELGSEVAIVAVSVLHVLKSLADILDGVARVAPPPGDHFSPAASESREPA